MARRHHGRSKDHGLIGLSVLISSLFVVSCNFVFLPRRALLGGLGTAIAVTSASQEVRAEDFVQYVEKDPAITAFKVSRPAGWQADEQVLKKSNEKEYGRILTYVNGYSRIEVKLEPVDDNKIGKLPDIGPPELFAYDFANRLIAAAPATADPVPVPKVGLLGMESTPDFRRTIQQYVLEVKGRPTSKFLNLVGIAEDGQGRNYFYSLTGEATAEDWARSKPIFVNVFKSFEIPGATAKLSGFENE